MNSGIAGGEAPGFEELALGFQWVFKEEIVSQNVTILHTVGVREISNFKRMCI